jgi:hypothetical protein
MSNTNTGGTAFPGLNAEFTGITSDGEERYEIQPSGGMTLRDYFAAHALNSLGLTYHFGPNGTSHRPVADEVAAYAYKMADAMLKARQA